MAKKAALLPSEGPHYYEVLPGQTDVEEWLAANTAPRSVGDNGGPPLDEPPYQTLARIGRAAHGSLWEGKLAGPLHLDPRQLRRWRDGQGVPTPRAVAKARAWAVRTAAALLAAAGEDALAEAVGRRRDEIQRAARERGREVFRQALGQKGGAGG